MSTPQKIETKRKLIAPLGFNFSCGVVMQIIVQRLNHSNRWVDAMQWKFAQFSLKACRFLDLPYLKKRNF
jgi:hypothetical protein